MSNEFRFNSSFIISVKALPPCLNIEVPAQQIFDLQEFDGDGVEVGDEFVVRSATVASLGEVFLRVIAFAANAP